MTVVGERSLGHPIVGTDEQGAVCFHGGQCPTCGDVRVPRRELCAFDLSRCVGIDVAGTGTVYEAVLLQLAPQGFDAPLWVGFIDLDAGPRVFAQLRSAEGWLPCHGDRVVAELDRVSAAEGAALGPIFTHQES